MSRPLKVLLAVAAFVAVCALFWSLSEEGGNSGGIDALWTEISVGVALIFVASFLFGIVRARSGAKELNLGAGLMSQGRYVDALVHFERARSLLLLSPAPHLNLAACHLALWRLQAAEAAIEESKLSTLFRKDLGALLAPALALVRAIRGELAGARSALAEADRSGNGASALALLASAVLEFRERRFSEGLALLGRPELRTLGAMPRALADALRAWGTLETTGQRLPVDAIAVYGESGPDPVRQAWPELAEFLDGVTSVTASPNAQRA